MIGYLFGGCLLLKPIFLFPLLYYLIDFFVFIGLGNFSCTPHLTQVKGDIEGVKIIDITCRCDTVLALSGWYL